MTVWRAERCCNSLKAWNSFIFFYTIYFKNKAFLHMQLDHHEVIVILLCSKIIPLYLCAIDMSSKFWKWYLPTYSTITQNIMVFYVCFYADYSIGTLFSCSTLHISCSLFETWQAISVIRTMLQCILLF
jgi:hypothetical protein